MDLRGGKTGSTIAGAVMDGVLVIDKPAGWTSHDVVAKVRSVLGVRKAGHTGTLDPSATGVLVLCLGKATRVAEYLIDCDKAYRGVLRLGVATDTQDATGTVIARHEGPLPDESGIREVMARFVGRHQQVPPMYSAVKVRGVPLYKSARAGRIVPREPRVCLVRSLEILSILPTSTTESTARVPVASQSAMGEGPPSTIVGVGGAPSGPPFTLDVTFDVVCAKGTYIRTLCADIGEALGIGGHLAFLQRRRVGRFDIADALSLDDLTASATADEVSSRLHPIDSVLSDWPALTVDHEAAEGIRHGVPVSTARVVGMEGDWTQGARVRLLDQNGRLLAIGRVLYGREELSLAPPGTAVRVEKVLA